MDIVFDGPTGPVGPRFVETEIGGRGVGLGEWVEREDGLHAIRYTPEDLEQAAWLTRLVSDWGEHIHIPDYTTHADRLRHLALWAGDDGKAQAYWLEHCPASLRESAAWRLQSNLRGCIALFNEVADGSYAVPGVAVIEDPPEALGRILIAIGKGELAR